MSVPIAGVRFLCESCLFLTHAQYHIESVSRIEKKKQKKTFAFMHATNTLVKCKYCEMANYRQWSSSTSSSSQRIYAYQFFPYFFIFNFFVFRLKWISWKEISWIGLALCVDILIVIMVKRNVEMEIERKRRRKKSCLPLKFNSIAELRLSLSLCDALCFFSLSPSFWEITTALCVQWRHDLSNAYH